MIVLNPNENSLEVEKVPDPAKKPSPDASDEPAEKRERKEERESKKKKDFYEKYRNPQKERETEHIPIRVSGRGRMMGIERGKGRWGEIEGERGF